MHPTTEPLLPHQRIIADHVDASSKVIDIGCGRGGLLMHLVEQKGCDGRGIELDPVKVAEAVSRGLAVIQGDADTDLVHYPDGCFDYAVLGHTLQVMHRPKEVLEELLRIANTVIISIPNFGYWQTRWYLGARGRMPVTRFLSYEWYETPNIHFCTIKDFDALCREVSCRVKRRIFLSKKGRKKRSTTANLLAEQAVYILSR